MGSSSTPKVSYHLMFYKNGPSFGIRRRRAKQVLNICKKGVPVETLKVLAQKALNSLNQGMDVDEAKLVIAYSK